MSKKSNIGDKPIYGSIAYDRTDQLIRNSFAIYTLNSGDHTDFWNLFKEVEKQYDLSQIKDTYTLNDFKSGKTFYYINPNGKVQELTVHSGISPRSAFLLSKAFVLFNTWTEANDVLTQLKDTFTFYKDSECLNLQT